MEKPKRWHRYLLTVVALLVLGNILSTVFYYTKPLRDPIDATRAEVVATEIVDRVNTLDDDAIDWVYSFTKHIKIYPTSVTIDQENPSQILVSFSDIQDANLLRTLLPRAGALISFIPSQLSVGPVNEENPTQVIIQRKLGVELAPTVSDQFQFVEKFAPDGSPTPEYKQIVHDRILTVTEELAGDSLAAKQLEAIVAHPNDPRLDELAIGLAKRINEVENTFGKDHPVTTRYFASFTHSSANNRTQLINQYIHRLESISQRLTTEKNQLKSTQEKLEESGSFLDPSQQASLQIATANLKAIENALGFLMREKSLFEKGLKTSPLSPEQVLSLLKTGTVDPASGIQKIDLQNHHPFFSGASLDWTDNLFVLELHDDLKALKDNSDNLEVIDYMKERLNTLLISEVARISRTTDESIRPQTDEFTIALSDLTNSSSLLTLDLGAIAKSFGNNLIHQLQTDWHPYHSDLDPAVYPILSWQEYQALPASEKRLGITVYSPAMEEKEPPEGFRQGSLYVIARGMNSILEKYQGQSNDPGAERFIQDITRLHEILASQDFVARSGQAWGFDPDFSRDAIFELPDFYTALLGATRENFRVHGSKKLAVLEFSDVEQRILAKNRIEDRAHEDLLKWKDDYQTAQVSMDSATKRNIPPPTKNTYWQNLLLSTKKYFRGDDRKILRWGLDLSGGKTVRIGLSDQNGNIVTDPEQLNQAVNELYNRINKMGVAERSIRIENNNIILEFPGSQALSAAELIKASAMHFHIVNEKFGLLNPLLGENVNSFLQEVWEEASVTNRTDPENLALIAWEHLGGEEDGAGQPRSEAARTLVENGLRLANPRQMQSSNAFDDRISRVVRLRGEDHSAWQGQTHPLLIVLNNFALEGSALTNVYAAYDAKEGNVLQFSVKRSYDNRSGSPRDDFYTWTSQYSQDKVAGTQKEQATNGRGWRLAVILNEEVVNAPELRGALREGGSITGRFTQREINQLVADLKAGSLTFTPKILSEHNISPELGSAERNRGITAAIIGFVLVVICMVSVYRFAGVVASVALIFNLLMIWAVLQNIGAALSLPGIAAIVLTMGMAVDANVLVFERTREEYKHSGRLGSALQAGYRKAFSAIIDSNLTTVIAALILIQFDSGPIKGFAITLIIGIVASMFSALFMTRFFFASWIQGKPKAQLPMMEFLTNTKIDWLKIARPAMVISAVVIVLGCYQLVEQRNTLFGMDFTGGYALTVDVEEKGEQDYRKQATEALLSAGASITDIQVQELSRSNQLRIQLGISMEEEGHPFFGMPQELREIPSSEESSIKGGPWEWEKNPRISWVVQALQKGGVNIQQVEMPELDKDWTSMSGQFSDAMRTNALLALGAALISILVYITFRFEFKYAVAAVIGLAHDVLISLGLLAIMHNIGMPVQIDLQVVGAIMTIIGYSLNDTIIVFDRVREDLELYRKLSFAEVVNQAVNVTLSRTIMTSLTTLLVLFSLVLLGGSTIFTFALVMTIGVIVGTLSTLFIAAPMLVYMHNREEEKNKTHQAIKVI